MAASARALVDLVLLGPAGDRRQLQDSPILGDVWLKFAARPGQRLDLLITPHRDHPAGPVARNISEALRILNNGKGGKDPALVAYLQGLVAARLTFRELLRVIVPRTAWWRDREVQEKLMEQEALNRLKLNTRRILDWAKAGSEDRREECAEVFSTLSSLDRYVALAGILLWANEGKPKADHADETIDLSRDLPLVEDSGVITGKLQALLNEIRSDAVPDKERAQVWQVSLNRKAMPALEKSVPAVKGDAARTLFRVKCDEIRWAILDSGIDGSHPAFRDPQNPNESRVLKAFDFSNIRKIVSLDNAYIDEPDMKDRLTELRLGGIKEIKEKDAIRDLKQLAEDAENDRPIHWASVQKFIEVNPGKRPSNVHGTHVAGIIGARGDQSTAGGAEPDGLCPEIKLYDFRVLGKTLEETEFAIIAALQFIRYMNERHGHISIHGANLSLSIPHDVRNFACGRTPICNECEHLVESGVVVVAAAGNLGYHSFETKDGGFDSYAAFSITDPGNADGVITVGATHRFWPHTYGVSFFSSRGPTGDGRLKPDIVAPGERIRSCMPGTEWGELDGTSMAAPHVSGAAAMLLARYSELIGQPRKIKRILCESATDLGRERTFQGHGMLDVLRAFQQI